MQAVITHKVGGISSGLKPPTILNPGGVVVQGAVAEGIVVEQAVKTGIVIADGHGHEQSGIGSTSSGIEQDQIHPQEPQLKESEAPQKSVTDNDKIAPAVRTDDTSEISSLKTIAESDLPHIFRNKPGHFGESTEVNRQILISIASDFANFLGKCERGSLWYAKTLENGIQIWAEVRNGQVRNGGFNSTPKIYNPKTGLKKHF